MKVHNRFIKAFGALLIAALLFGAMPAGEVKAQTGQDLYVAEWGTPATAYDPASGAPRPMVVYDGSQYHIWYGLGDNALYYTTSSDPASFGAGTLTTFKDTSELVYLPYEVASPAIVYEGSTFYMITYKTGTNLVFSIYTSSDGNTWTYKGDVYSGEGLGTQGTDWRKIDSPVLVPDGGTYKLYFQVPHPTTGAYNIFMAETGATTLADIADSDDDTDFTLANSNNPVLTIGSTGEPDDLGVQHPMVVKDDGTYYMWYTGIGTGTYAWRSINFATSPDGITWTKSPANPIIKELNSHAEPTVVKVGDVWHLWHEYNETSIQYVSASGPFEFQTIQSAIDAASVGDTIEVGPGEYDEDVIVNKNITLQGKNAPDGVDAAVINGLLYVTADGATVESLKVVPGNVEGQKAGISITASNVTVTGNYVADMTGDGSKSIKGIYVYNDNLPALTNIVISENKVENINNSASSSGYAGSSGIMLQGVLDGIDVLDNVILNITSEGWVYGIEVTPTNTTDGLANPPANVLIENNEINSVNPTGTDVAPYAGVGFSIDVAGPENTPADASEVVLRYNKFLNTPLSVVNKDSVNTLDAKANWFDGTEEPSNTYGLIDYNPWCYTADCSELYVADGGLIQDGIDLVKNSTVYVGPGTYAEEIEIYEAVNLIGPNAGIDPNTGVREDEAIITPETTESWFSVYIEAGNVLLDGFTIDGEDTIDYGIYAANSDPVGPVTIQNNRVLHIEYYSFLGYVENAVSSGNVVQNNLFQYCGERAILPLWNYYANVLNNTIKDTSIGIYSENTSKPSGVIPVVWANNTIEATRSGIWYNLAYGNATSLQIKENTITAIDDTEGTRFDGIWLTSLGGSVDPEIADNVIIGDDITQLVTGYHLWNDTTTATDGIKISGGSVSDADYGIWANNWDGYPTSGGSEAGPTTAKIEDIEISDSRIAGLYIKDNPLEADGDEVIASIFTSELTNNVTGILVEGDDAHASGDHNKIVGSTTDVESSAIVTLDFEENYWGSPCGPVVIGDVDYIPWFADEAMLIPRTENVSGTFTLTTAMTSIEKNAIIECAEPNTVFTFEVGTEAHAGGIIVNNDYLTFNLNGAEIGSASPAFTINGDYIVINGPGTLDGGGSSDHAIVVDDGVIDFTLDTVEILNWADGLHFNGVITDTVIVDNFIHDNTGDAVYFGAQPVAQTGDSFYIQGNMFKDNVGVGVNNAGTTADVNAEYNSWGDYSGSAAPDGDGSTNAGTDPITHVEVFIESTNPDVDNWSRQVFVGEQITYEVTADLRQVMGADFVLEFPTNLSVASHTVGTVFDENYVTITGNEIHFEAYQKQTEVGGVTIPAEPVADGQGYLLFTVTFDADTVGKDLPLNFDETTDNFSMSPGYGPSLNIYADELVDATLDVIDRPTLAITGLEDPLYAGVMSQEITLETCNPLTGGDWTESVAAPIEPDTIGWVRIEGIDLDEIASLQFLYDGVWYDFSVQDQYGGTAVQQDGVDVIARFGNYNFGLEIPVDWCDIDKFRVTFINPGSYDVTVSIYDMMDTPFDGIDLNDILLVETSVVITVEAGDFEGVGTISMQGRTERLGVPVTLLSDWYTDALFYSTSTISDNLRVTTSGGLYTFTTNQPRYLNVTADLEKFIWVDGSSPYEIATIELKGGNAKWVDDNTIDLDDASIVGANYGKLPSDPLYNENADVNFDGKVSIQDLALVGGNYDLTSEVAYAAWSPQADETVPGLDGVSPAEGPVVLGAEEPFVWIVDASDAGDNLYELEVDHSMEGTIPEFSVYANEGNPYGTLAEKAEFESNGVYVTYIAADQMWIINFGETITDAFVDNGGITFYVVLKDRNGNQFGTMSGTTSENTFVYTFE